MEKNKTKDTYYMLLDKDNHKIFSANPKAITFDNFDYALKTMNEIPEAKYIIKVEETIIWDKINKEKLIHQIILKQCEKHGKSVHYVTELSDDEISTIQQELKVYDINMTCDEIRWYIPPELFEELPCV